MKQRAYGQQTEGYAPFCRVMTILLVGDEHTYGYGLSARQLSYMGHFVRQLSRTGRSVTVEVYAHLTIPETTAMLTRLPLSHYDLIVLQLGPDLMERGVVGSRPAQSTHCLWLPLLNPPGPAGEASGRPGWLKRVGSIGKTLVTLAASFVPASNRAGGLAALLNVLRPYRHTVMLMTPLPCRTLPGQWRRMRSRSILLKKRASQGFSVFDTAAVVLPHDEYFLPDDGEHLNAVSHELIGRALFDFYQSAPTIVTVQTINRH